MSLQTRVISILSKPKQEWPVIASEATDIAALFKGYIMPLAAIPRTSTVCPTRRSVNRSGRRVFAFTTISTRKFSRRKVWLAKLIELIVPRSSTSTPGSTAAGGKPNPLAR